MLRDSWLLLKVEWKIRTAVLRCVFTLQWIEIPKQTKTALQFYVTSCDDKSKQKTPKTYVTLKNQNALKLIAWKFEYLCSNY